MPIKCKSCRHFGTDIMKRQIFVNGRPTGQHVNDKAIRFCKNLAVTTAEIDEMFPARHGMPIDMAREICDREGDGHFVYFEPKTPTAGAAFAGNAGDPPASPTGDLLSEPGAIATGLPKPAVFARLRRDLTVQVDGVRYQLPSTDLFMNHIHTDVLITVQENRNVLSVVMAATDSTVYEVEKQIVQITREKKECSCYVGACRGPENLGQNYQCVLARPAAMTAAV